jgi:hypothetical protein
VYQIQQGAVLEIRERYRVANQEVMNIHHYKYTDPSAITNGGGIAYQVAEAWQNDNDDSHWAKAVLYLISSAYLRYKVQAQWIWPTRYMVQDYLTTRAGIGTGGMTNPSDSLSFERRGEKANRHSIGGVRVSGLDAGMISNGQVTAAGASIAVSCAVALVQPIGPPWYPINLSPIIWNRKDPNASEPVFTGGYAPEVHTMKRRVVRRGI